MTTGNIFQLYVNDGSISSILYGNKILSKTLHNARNVKINNLLKKEERRFLDPINRYTDIKFDEEIDLFQGNPIRYIERKYKKELLPTFDDLRKTHNIFINYKVKPALPTVFSYSEASDAIGMPSFGNEIEFRIPNQGYWTADMFINITIEGLKTVNEMDKVKYADLLGHKLIEEVRLIIDDNDDIGYTSEYVNKYYQTDVPTDKKQAWLRMMGQEEIHKGYITPEPTIDEYRQILYFSNGAQTFKREHAKVNIQYPLLFWFNDFRQAYPNRRNDYFSMKIKLKFAPIEKLIATHIQGVGSTGELILPTITKCKLYANQIETTREIADVIYSQMYDYQLIRIPQEFTRPINSPEGNIKFNNIKYLVESLTVGIRPQSNEDNIDIWHRNTKLTRQFIPTPIVRTSTTPSTLGINNAYFFTEQDTITECALSINGVNIYRSLPEKLYSSYIPYKLKGYISPPNKGWLVFPFQKQKNKLEPSGWIDFRQRSEIYLEYKSDVIDTSNLGKLIVIAETLNFLVFNNNKTYLKYT
jgi:hypothetical protein